MMMMQDRNNEEVIEWLEQEYAQPFEGWDFSYLHGRRTPLGTLPWGYDGIAIRNMHDATSILDIDTGGGEVLSKLLEATAFEGGVSAVEAYAPNVSIAREHLEGFGVEVHDASDQSAQLADDAYDLVLNRHGGSLTPRQIHRVLRNDGVLVTEQIGDRSNVELREYFAAQPPAFADWPHNADDAARAFNDIGFEPLQAADHTYPVRFYDVGALVYFLKAIPWEIPGFSVAGYADALLRLHRVACERGFAIDATYHAYLLVARKL